MEVNANTIGIVIVCTIIGVTFLLKVIDRIESFIDKRRDLKNSSFEDGRNTTNEQNELMNRFKKDEELIKKLSEELDKLITSIESINTSLKYLNESDNLQIKFIIKQYWEKSVANGEFIDDHEFDLLERRYDIYKARGGNSWAKRMMEDIVRTRVKMLENQQNKD